MRLHTRRYIPRPRRRLGIDYSPWGGRAGTQPSCRRMSAAGTTTKILFDDASGKKTALLPPPPWFFLSATLFLSTKEHPPTLSLSTDYQTHPSWWRRTWPWCSRRGSPARWRRRSSQRRPSSPRTCPPRGLAWSPAERSRPAPEASAWPPRLSWPRRAPGLGGGGRCGSKTHGSSRWFLLEHAAGRASFALSLSLAHAPAGWPVCSTLADASASCRVLSTVEWLGYGGRDGSKVEGEGVMWRQRANIRRLGEKTQGRTTRKPFFDGGAVVSRSEKTACSMEQKRRLSSAYLEMKGGFLALGRGRRRQVATLLWKTPNYRGAQWRDVHVCRISVRTPVMWGKHPEAKTITFSSQPVRTTYVSTTPALRGSRNAVLRRPKARAYLGSPFFG